MTQHPIGLAAMAALALTAAACNKNPVAGPAPAPGPSSAPMSAQAPAQTAAPGAPVYEAVYVPGSNQVSAGMLRINTNTGQVVAGFGAPVQMVSVPDLPLPAGQYHLRLWSQPAAADGSVAWGASRMDAVSGRIWVLSGNATAYNWIELTPPR